MTFAPRYLPLALIGTAMMLTGVSACRRHPDAHPGRALVAAMDDSVLTLREVQMRIPAGVTPADSQALANSIIEGWIEDRLFSTYLSLEPAEEQRIERLAEEYRRKLRLEAYRRRIRREHELPVSNDSVMAFYRDHFQDMVTERPLVRGIYVKLPADSPLLPEVRSLMHSATQEDVERLETELSSSLTDYAYFGESWVEFDLLSAKIPYRFGDADMFLSGSMDFETKADDMVYLLHIYNVTHSGERMPRDFAETQIRDILQESRLEAYRRGLLRALRQKARGEGRLRYNGEL